MQLQPARWDKPWLPPANDDDNDDNLNSDHRVSLPPRVRPKRQNSAYGFRMIKQASPSVASVDKELVPIPSPPWAKAKPLPQDTEGSTSSSTTSSRVGIRHSESSTLAVPTLGSARPSSTSSRSSLDSSKSPENLPVYHDSDGESEIDTDMVQDSPPRSSSPPSVFPSKPSTYRPPSPLPARYDYPPSQLLSAKPHHPYYRSHSFDYHQQQQFRPLSPTRPRSYHHPSSSSVPSSMGRKRRYASDDERDLRDEARRRRVDIGRENGFNLDNRRKEDLDKASRTLPPLPPFRPGGQTGFWPLSHSSQNPRSGPLPSQDHRNDHYYQIPPSYHSGAANRSRAPASGEYFERPSPSDPYLGAPRYPPSASNLHYPPPHRNEPAVSNRPPSYRRPSSGQRSRYMSGSYDPPPEAYRSLPLPHTVHNSLPSNGTSTIQDNALPPEPHSQSSAPNFYFHKIKLNRPRLSKVSTPASFTASQAQFQVQESQQLQMDQKNETLYQQAAASRYAAYSSPGTVDSTTLTTHPVPYSVSMKADPSVSSITADAGRLVGEYEQHPLRQQTSYLPISAVGGAQFVLKPPRIRKVKSKFRFMMSTLQPPPHPQAIANVSTNFAGTNEYVVKPAKIEPNVGEELIEIKQEEGEEERVTSSIAAITIAESTRPTTNPVEENTKDSQQINDMTSVMSLKSSSGSTSLETNTFAGPVRPLKKYPSGDEGYTFIMESDVEEEDAMDVRPDSGDSRKLCPSPHFSPSKSIRHAPNGLTFQNLPEPSPSLNNRPPSPSDSSMDEQSMKHSPTIAFVEFRPPLHSPPKPSSARPAPSAAPMSAYTSTFPAQPLHMRTKRAQYRLRHYVPVSTPQERQQPIELLPPVALCSPPISSLPVPPEPTLETPTAPPPPPQPTTKTRRGPKPRRNDFDAVLDPSQTAAQGGQIRMRVLPQATYMPPVQPALAIMHEQPHVAKKKGKRTDGLVPEYGFVPREYVYRERE